MVCPTRSEVTRHVNDCVGDVAAWVMSAFVAAKTTNATNATKNRRGVRDKTDILIAQTTNRSERIAPYLQDVIDERASDESESRTNGRIVVVSVTRDHAEVWSLEERQTAALVALRRDDLHEEHRHVRPAQNLHGHGSDEGFDAYFARLAALIGDASEVMLAGHGRGKANAMEEFAEFLRLRRPEVFAKVSELRYLDATHISGRELAALARSWKRQQTIRD